MFGFAPQAGEPSFPQSYMDVQRVPPALTTQVQHQPPSYAMDDGEPSGEPGEMSTLQPLEAYTAPAPSSAFEDLPLALRRPRRQIEAPVLYSPDEDASLSEADEGDDIEGEAGPDDADTRDVMGVPPAAVPGDPAVAPGAAPTPMSDGDAMLAAADAEEAEDRERERKYLRKSNRRNRQRQGKGLKDLTSSESELDDGAKEKANDDEYVLPTGVSLDGPVSSDPESSSSPEHDSEISDVLDDKEFEQDPEELLSDFSTDDEDGEKGTKLVKFKDLVEKARRKEEQKAAALARQQRGGDSDDSDAMADSKPRPRSRKTSKKPKGQKRNRVDSSAATSSRPKAKAARDHKSSTAAGLAHHPPPPPAPILPPPGPPPLAPPPKPSVYSGVPPAKPPTVYSGLTSAPTATYQAPAPAPPPSAANSRGYGMDMFGYGYRP